MARVARRTTADAIAPLHSSFVVAAAARSSASLSPSLVTSAFVPSTRAETTEPRPRSTLPDASMTVDVPAVAIADRATSSTELATGQAIPRMLGVQPLTCGIGSAAGNALADVPGDVPGDGLGRAAPVGAGTVTGTTALSAASISWLPSREPLLSNWLAPA